MNAGCEIGTVCRENDSGGGVCRGSCHKGKGKLVRKEFQVIPHEKFVEETREIVKKYTKLGKQVSYFFFLFSKFAHPKSSKFANYSSTPFIKKLYSKYFIIKMFEKKSLELSRMFDCNMK